MRRIPVSIIALSALCSVPAAAQDAVTLDPVILSAGFGPIAGNAYGRAFTVLTADEIEAKGIAIEDLRDEL